MPILDPFSLEFFSKSGEQTRRLGTRLGSALLVGDVICLAGDLGSGKTTFTQGIAKGWGSLDVVTSPTFVIVNQYKKPEGTILHHMDAYRLENSEDAYNLDIEYMFLSGVLVIEWPDRIKGALPEGYLWIDLTWVDEFQRRMVFTPVGDRYRSLLTAFRQKAFGG
ncbi:MAG: tRNA (adenosine(37)-N6)-threonylcarbamoyltransferase complex ATPase subunit type 1 TsaE [Chloroflexi bacterium HGW-Chloroflexi-2]|jgi:tRNA threonylcarbamoyladenosine biosynthesis protein TsaE|nr:MAG: tRNA (adenosine(37)-N6)-threonylcarbamoyltransferase complex ATPase subunit type 1 TsaE [Chloroflexi bacterium HGW-Chloroflexi-2]